MKIIDDFKIAKSVFNLSGRLAYFWGAIGVLSGLIAFIFDFLLAICLQRFFISTGLIIDANQTRFFGTLKDSRSEAILLLIIGLMRMIMFWLNNASNGMTQVVFEKYAREKIAKWAIWEGKNSSGSVSNIYNDLLVGSSISLSLIQFSLSRVIMLVGSLTALAYYSVKLTALIFVLMILIIPLQKYVDKNLNRAGKGIQISLQKSSEMLFAGLQNSFYFRVHGLFNREINRFKKVLTDFGNFSARYYFLAGIRGILPQYIGLIYVVVVASRRGSSLLDNPGQLIAFLYLSIRFFQIVGELGRISANLKSSWPRLLKLFDWEQNEYKRIESSNHREFAGSNNLDVKWENAIGVEIDQITFAWPDKSFSIHKFSHNFEPGTWTTVFGTSGYGKSTILKLISGFIPPDSGAIHVRQNKENIKDAYLLQNNISFIEAEPVIISGTIKDNLLLGVDKKIDDAVLMQKIIDFDCVFILEMPKQLHTLLTENSTELSTGQKQRISILRALIREPKLLIMDEATSNLDSKTEDYILTKIVKMLPTITVIAASHRESYTKFSSQIIDLSSVVNK